MTFRQFWPHYLRAHRQPRTRVAHYIATALALSAIGATIYYQRPLIALGAIAASYLIALGSHRFLEGNRSLVFVNPVWGALADLKMCWLALTGRIAAELAVHVDPSAGSRDAGEYFSPHRDSRRRRPSATIERHPFRSP